MASQPGSIKTIVKASAIGSLCLVLLCQLATSTSAQETRTWIGHHFDECMANPAKVKVFAWAPAIQSYCRWENNHPLEQQKRDAVAECNKLVPEQFRTVVPCRVAFDGTKIVDPLLPKYMDAFDPTPVKIEVFDKVLGKLQKMSGFLESIPVRKGEDERWRVTNGKLVLCEGAAKSDDFRLQIRGSCFDIPLNIQGYAGTLVKVGPIYRRMVNSPRYEFEGSYLELTY